MLLQFFSYIGPSTVVVTIVLALVLHFWLSRPRYHLPPCPATRLPFLGNLLTVKDDPRKQFMEWRKTYGDIFRVHLGPRLMVVINGYDMIKEALVKNGDVFSDRPVFYVDVVTNGINAGVVSADGPNWKEQRTVSLSILRNFGMGKNLLAEKIQEEVTCYLDILSNFKEKPANLTVATNLSVSNIICSIIIGKRFDYEDQEFRKLIHNLEIIFEKIGGTNMLTLFPSLRHVPGDFFSGKKVAGVITEIMDYFKNKMSELGSKEAAEDTENVNNYITAYVIEKLKKERAGQNRFLDDINLLKTILDLFAAGTETTSTTMLWCVLYMLHHPDVQEKVFKEIEQEVGIDRVPSMHDKTKLKYLNAVIMETQRLASLVPLSVLHRVNKDIVLGGFTIPKDSLVAPNLDSILHDKSIWGEDADKFRPERFLDAENNLKNPEEFVPFSLGRRSCLGEALAKMELFLFLSSMFQRFQFLPENPKAPPPLTSDFGLTCPPTPYKVKVIDRRI